MQGFKNHKTMSDSKLAPKQIVDKMYENDEFSQWLGIQRIEDGEGRSILQMTVRKEMLNGFGIGHGGITYSLADSAFAFASNSRGRKAVSIETAISHLAPIKEGDVLIAMATEENISNKIGVYTIVIHNQHNQKVAHFKGTVYRTSKAWE